MKTTKKRLGLLLVILMLLQAAVVYGAISGPQNVTIERYGTGRVLLKWDPVEGASAYQVYYAIGKAKYKALGNTSAVCVDYIMGVPNKSTVKAYVVALVNGTKSGKSKVVSLKMVSTALPGYPNFPAHPDFTYDKDGAIKAHGQWTYIYSVDRVGEDFMTTYYEKVLKADHYSFFDSMDTMARSFVGTGDKRYGDFRDDAVFYTFHGYKENYVISRHHVVGTKRSEDYFSVTKGQ